MSCRSAAPRVRALLAVLPLVLVACTGPTSAPPTPATSSPSVDAPGAATPSATVPPVGEASTLGVDPAAVASVRDVCAPGPGKTVEELPDVELPAVDWPGTSIPAARAGSMQVEAVEVPPVRIPATFAEAGCVVTYAAPAGCLPQVEFSAAWIAAVRVPGYRVVQPDGTVEEVSGQEVPAESVPGAVVDQACQVVTENARLAVIRPGMVRPGLVRSGLVRPGLVRNGVAEPPESVPSASIPARSVPAASLPAQSVPGASLPHERLTDGVDAASGDDSVTYQAAESVLFEYGRSELLPSASAALDAVLADAQTKGFDGHVRVEGHTDDTGPDAGNQTLSEARAQAVAAYLAAHGVPSDRITATGFGETMPAHPNDSEENRARNRRVVMEFGSR